MSHLKWNGCLQLDICSGRPASQLCSPAARITVAFLSRTMRRIDDCNYSRYIFQHSVLQEEYEQTTAPDSFNRWLLIEGCQKKRKKPVILMHSNSISNVIYSGHFSSYPTGVMPWRVEGYFLLSIYVNCTHWKKGQVLLCFIYWYANFLEIKKLVGSQN